jgi:hypothetical protein
MPMILFGLFCIVGVIFIIVFFAVGITKSVRDERRSKTEAHPTNAQHRLRL